MQADKLTDTNLKKLQGHLRSKPVFIGVLTCFEMYFKLISFVGVLTSRLLLLF